MHNILKVLEYSAFLCMTPQTLWIIPHIHKKACNASYVNT